MSLLAESKITENAAMRARVAAAVRKTAATKGADGTAAGKLAGQGLMDPYTLVPHFLALAAANATIAAGACHDCGYSTAEDGDLAYVVASNWDSVAAKLHPETT